MKLAEELAEWLRSRYWLGRGVPVNVAGIALQAGVDEICLVREPLTDGRLERTASRTVIYVNDRVDRGRQQFTIAHELGHLVLAEVRGVSLDKQCNDPKIEKFCNWFAQSLLLPAGWVRERYRQADRGLGTVEDLARRTGTSPTASVSALNHLLGWQAGFLRWERDDRAWRLRRKTVPPPLRGEICSAQQSTPVLDALPRGRYQHLTGLPLLVRGELVTLPAEVSVTSYAITLIDAGRLLQPEMHDPVERYHPPDEARTLTLFKGHVVPVGTPARSVESRKDPGRGQLSFDWLHD